MSHRIEAKGGFGVLIFPGLLGLGPCFTPSCGDSFNKDLENDTCDAGYNQSYVCKSMVVEEGPQEHVLL